MAGKRYILDGYRFDIEDFTETQLQAIRDASIERRLANTDLRVDIEHEMRVQRASRKAYFRWIAIKRWFAYGSYYNTKVFAKFGIPESAVNWVRGVKKSALDSIGKATPKSIWEVAGEGTKKWEKETLGESDFEAPHLIAAMPADCLNLSGWERVKQAFMPKRFRDDYDENNPTHTFNKTLFVNSTLYVGLGCGLSLGIDYGRKNHRQFRSAEAGQLYESNYSAVRARHQAFINAFVKYGIRWSWRIGLMYGVIYGISQGLAIYRLEERASHYVLGASVAGALYSWTGGLVKMAASGALAAAIVGLPVGFMMCQCYGNPRPQWYFASAEPTLRYVHKEDGWSQAQCLLSRQRLVAILELLDTLPVSEKDEQFHRTFLGKDPT